MSKRIHHISAFIKDFETSHYFYQDVLGYKFVKNTVNQANVKMRHLFYGDYEGNPGTLLTFFEIPRIGKSYNKKAYFGQVTLAVPKNSLNFWYERLKSFEVETERLENQLIFSDPDGLTFALSEVSEEITERNATRHTDIPRNKQIIRILDVVYHVPDAGKAKSFLAGFGVNEVTTRQTLSKEKTRFGRGTIDHVAYEAATKEELDALYEFAQTNDIEVEEYVDRGYFISLYVRDPFGLRIEFANVTPGFTLDESVDELGTHFSLPPFLEPRRTEIENYFGGKIK
ncbi:glyoxalase/bleomycin resistance protein/dioxygenase [Listeria fleischmannii 1991]|uniref:Ring-cleaving dioxygenase mhqO n=2 Tax=Listeria fleischmannii TaxID=1069827 RepID=A0A2X3HAU9_9LIST|nr:VOC family protein [Listeria fleischmannii]EMG28389.1 glyoxalase/bleomycin resistance protein/dioxygenase [Listeria fleischmannii subsp. fleischmannii LU2006-1]KMT58482.1 glyoxalase/bleomycin resistance protein/dioxygenase [Listeria fleischmannii 1991]SQC69873.1 Putative ring-cleaving dioxygenase mhqO [Listeria fleischmannii subsp. fleischmannii]